MQGAAQSKDFGCGTLGKLFQQNCDGLEQRCLGESGFALPDSHFWRMQLHVAPGKTFCSDGQEQRWHCDLTGPGFALAFSPGIGACSKMQLQYRCAALGKAFFGFGRLMCGTEQSRDVAGGNRRGWFSLSRLLSLAS